MRIFDCTLRDGANVVGNGFSPELTESMIRGLLGCGIQDILAELKRQKRQHGKER